jgi:L-lysine 2,3-aminomutase
LAVLAKCRKSIFFVIHANHPLELDNEVLDALRLVHKLGIPILNQSVLLKGVNDNLATLTALSRRLLEGGILPYYLHLLDPVTGSSRFQITDNEAVTLYKSLQASLTGLGVPKLVREIPHRPSKTIMQTTEN